MPELFIIAGPNGAGKSTLSALLVKPGVFVFDGDKELGQLQNRFPGIDDAVLFESVGEVYKQRIHQAIGDKVDFAIETNFASEAIMETVEKFKSCGYIVNLIYLGLPSINQAINRVLTRVDKGGHFVSAENIKSNYNSGLVNLKRYFKQFDVAVFIHNAIVRDKPIKIINVATFSKGKVIDRVPAPPKWAKSILEPPKKAIKLLEKKTIRRGKGLGL